MSTLQWIPLISTLSLGLAFIMLAYCFAAVTI
jgi:hypothetical protein